MSELIVRRMIYICSNYGSEMGWSYGDSNPRPLACHEARTQPLTSANTP
jgi:hypothetical protein